MTILLKPASETQILIVDDTLANVLLLSKIFEPDNYIIRKSLSGKLALQAAYYNPPDLILLNINMSELNGYEVCQQLKASEVTSEIPVIFISASDQPSDKAQMFELGGQDYITKPFHWLEVLARAKNQLLIQQQKQQLEQEILNRQGAEAEIQRLNADLNRQVQVQTLELQQSLSFELALRQISDKVRDSLDQHQILQAAVETLAWALEIHCCHTALYRENPFTSTIQYQWVQPGFDATQGQIFYTTGFPQVYEQLQQRTCFAFCPTQLSPIPHHAAILVCPIFDDQVNPNGILGNFCLFREADSSFSEMEISLVQQVADQCAIALRQARLYEEAQARIKELEHLSQLKDDFLNTISHEIRTPIASMKMVIELLTVMVNQGQNSIESISQSSSQGNRINYYLKVLKEECDREIALVDNLLNLQQIESGTYSARSTPIPLQSWIPPLIQPFAIRTQNQNQTLQVNLAADLPILSIDSFSFDRIITELLSNACKYTPSGETISLSVSITQDTTAVDSVESLQLIVANTGVEIPPEELPRIFDKFYRIPNYDPWKFGGTGLGLALVKKLVEQMGGAIEGESANNQTCFTVVLPLS